jgi:hypothetical protein
MKFFNIILLMVWPYFQDYDHHIEQSLFTLSFEGVIDERHTYRQKETILGMTMLNPIVNDIENHGDTNYVKLTVFLEGSIRDGVKVFQIKKLNKGVWEFLAGNRYYFAHQYLGITENGKINFKIDEIKDLHLMFIDSDNCLPITGLQVSYSK